MHENLSVSEIYRRLIMSFGFQDPDEFALKRLRQNVSEEVVAKLGVARAIQDFQRGTGRTTRRMVEAMTELSAGREVIFVGHSKEFAQQMANQIFKYGCQIGVSSEKLSSCSFATKNRYLAGRPSHTVVVEDHYYGP